MNNNFILVILLIGVLYLVGTTYFREKTVVPITVESLVCDHYDDKNNCVFTTDGAFTISINSQASTCSIMYESYKEKSVNFGASQSLAYVDENNWECREKPSPPFTAANGFKMGNFQNVYQMSKGILKILSEDLDHIVGPMEYKIQRKSGL